MTDVTTQQVDTLSIFLNEHQVSREGLIEAIKMRNQRRQEWADTVKTHASLSDKDLIGMNDHVLEQLAKTYAVPSIQGQAVANTEQPATFVGRGLPVAQQTEAQVEPLRRPQVLVNKRDQKAS